MTADYQVKGSSLRSKFDFVRERFGGPAERELKALFAATGVFPILDSSLYPFALYDRVNRAIAERFFAGDLCRLEEVGAYSAERVLTTIYRAFADGKDFVGFLERAALLHGRFYDRGRMEVRVGENRRSARIVLRGAPLYSEADLHVAAGFYAGAARLLGIAHLRQTFRHTPDGVDFELSW